MHLDSKALFQQYSFRKTATDSGSPESQIAVLTHRIKHITEHLKAAPKDFSAQRGLIKLVGKQKKMRRYLEATDTQRARTIKAALALRK